MIKVIYRGRLGNHAVQSDDNYCRGWPHSQYLIESKYAMNSKTP